MNLSIPLDRIYNYNKKFWEEMIAYFPLIIHGPHVKYRVQNSSFDVRVFIAAVTCLPSRCLAKAVSSASTIPAFKRCEGTQTHRQQDDLISFLFFQNKESSLKLIGRR
jgi:hypothetical protein